MGNKKKKKTNNNKKSVNTKTNQQQKNVKKKDNVDKKEKTNKKETNNQLDITKTITINTNDINGDKADKIKEIFLDTVESKKSKPIKTIILSIIITLLVIGLGYSIFLNFVLYKKKSKTDIVYKYRNDENIVFYGDSITSKYEIENFFPKNKIINSGKSGDIASDLVNRINDDVYKYNPSKVFILIGINDLTRNVDKDEILNNIQEVITGIKIHRKYAKIYIESIYPINKDYMKEKEYKFNDELTNDDIIEFNKEIKKMAKNNDIIYINVYDSLLDKDGNLNREYSKEGLHLNDVGYLKVSNVLTKYIKEK